jgi:hypothetical protein
VTAHSGSHLDDLIHHFMADDVARQHCRNEIVKEVRGSLLPSQAMKVRIKIRNSHFFSDVISAIPDADCRYAQFEARDRWFDCDAPHILVFHASATHERINLRCRGSLTESWGLATVLVCWLDQ